MPAPVPVPIRQAIWARHQEGVSTAVLADQFGLASRTVRGLIRRARERGVEGLKPDSTHPRPAVSSPAREEAVRLRREHPTWGAGVIRVWMQRSGVIELACARQMQRWFAAAGLNPAPRGQRPASAGDRAISPHETWQVDASERIDLADGTQVSWLRIVDEFTGAVLSTVIFPPRGLD